MTLWFESALLPDGWARSVRIVIADGRIGSVERNVSPAADDERHFVALPGLTNIHSHAFQRGMAGLTEYRGNAHQDNFWTWRALMYQFLDRIDPDDVAAIAAQAYCEMLQSGFTRVAEFHYLHHDETGAPYGDCAEMAGRIVEATEQTGIGLTLLPVYYAQGGFGGAPAEPGQRRFLSSPDAFANLYEASRTKLRGIAQSHIGVAPHSLRAVTPADLKRVIALAPDGPIHMHAAEQIQEVRDSIAWSGRPPVEWLLDEMAIDHRWCLVHATHLTQSEMTRLAASGAVAALCPVTEANLGDGIFPAQSYLALKGAIAIGTDSNILIDAADELRALEYAQRLSARIRNALALGEPASTGRALFDAVLSGGARAAGVSSVELAPGSGGDIVALDGESPALTARRKDSLLDSWIFAAGRDAVRDVWCRGVQVVKDGRHIHGERIAERYRRTLKKLLTD